MLCLGLDNQVERCCGRSVCTCEGVPREASLVHLVSLASVRAARRHSYSHHLRCRAI